MDVAKVVKELKKRYLGKNIALNPPENPMEIICEIEPGEHHLAKGKETWVKVTSTPAWIPDDQFVVAG